jgi:hypothetical protein
MRHMNLRDGSIVSSEDQTAFRIRPTPINRTCLQASIDLQKYTMLKRASTKNLRGGGQFGTTLIVQRQLVNVMS